MNRQRWTLVATVLASATVFLDSTIVNVALPKDRTAANAVGIERQPKSPS